MTYHSIPAQAILNFTSACSPIKHVSESRCQIFGLRLPSGWTGVLPVGYLMISVTPTNYTVWFAVICCLTRGCMAHSGKVQLGENDNARALVTVQRCVLINRIWLERAETDCSLIMDTFGIRRFCILCVCVCVCVCVCDAVSYTHLTLPTRR